MAYVQGLPKGHGGRLRAAYELPGCQRFLWRLIFFENAAEPRKVGTGFRARRSAEKKGLVLEDYNFWKEFFDTYQSLPDWMKLAWLIVPPGFLLSVFAIFLHFRMATKRSAHTAGETLAYTIYAGKSGRLRIYAHEGAHQLPTEPPRLADRQRPALDELSDF